MAYWKEKGINPQSGKFYIEWSLHSGYAAGLHVANQIFGSETHLLISVCDVKDVFFDILLTLFTLTRKCQ